MMFKLNFYLLVFIFLQINKINCSDKSVELTAPKTLIASNQAELLEAQLAENARIMKLQAEAFELMLADNEPCDSSKPAVSVGLLTKEQELALAEFIASSTTVSTKPAHKHKIPSGLKDFVDSSGSSGEYARVLQEASKPVVKK